MKKVGCTFSAEFYTLIVTTRTLEVCRQLCCQRVIQVEKLGEGEAWKLFNETLGDETELGPHVEEIAKSMTKLCDGLPLEIITVAGSMRGEKAIHRWKNALTELEESVVGLDGMGDIKVFKVLEYSFNGLKRNGELESKEPNMIQHCFLYCSLYPEDYAIDREDLVREFISDGLVDGRRSRRAQVEQGLSILDKLVNLCLLESCVDSSNGESVKMRESVKMHDLVRSMALRICKGKYLVRAGKWSLKKLPYEEEKWTEDLEKVSLMECGINGIEEGHSPDCPKLSTLLLSGNPFSKVIPESFFCKMQGLCTLDLSWNHGIAMLPNSISDLTCLKSLILENCPKLEKVPYLGMKALRELNLSYTAIKEAPQGVDELLNLRLLSMNARGLKILPRGLLLKLGHLEHLNIPLHIQVSTEEMENLKRLEEFSGGVKSVSDFNWFVRSRAHDVTCYIIGVSKKDDVESLISELRWPKAPNNNELELLKCDIKDEKVMAKGIAYLTIRSCVGLSKCFGDDLWERFDNPTSLKKLDITSCRGIEWIMRSEDGQLLSTLEEINLWWLGDLKGVVMQREKGEIGASAAQPPVFSSLKGLFSAGCKKMRKLGLPAVSSLPNLREIRIGNCDELEDIFEDEDEGRAAAASILPKLRELELEDLPRLKRVSKATIISNSIEYIVITKCPELMNKLPLCFDDQTAPPPSLQKIRVERGWWESLEWDNPLLPILLHPFLHFSASWSSLTGLGH